MTTDWATSRNDDRQRVLDATDIVALVGEHLAIHAKGREYVAICPFHDDHKPSMTVVPHKQIFHCFSCGAGGNAYDFMMRFHGMDFRETIQRLADRAGITLTPYKPGASEQPASDSSATRDDIARANAFALSFYRSIFNHKDHGSAARDAIAKRGFTDETIEDFQIGAAPDRWDGLLLTIGKQNLNTDHFLAAGLLKRRDTGGLYDALRNRIVFPILDQIGRPIAFGARRINEEDEPKYLNSPENALFDKSATLFALDKAARPIQRERRAIIVEGYTDAIACHQAGVSNAVATLGTALTSKHATALQRLCDRVVLLFDADTAGLKAADRGVEIFFSSNVDVHIAVLPAGADPADLLETENGREQFDATIDSAEDAMTFRFRRLSEQLDGVGVSARAKAIERDIERLVELGLGSGQPIRRRLIIRNYAALVGVDEQLVIETIAKAQAMRNRRGFISANSAAAQTNDEQSAEPIANARLTPFDHALGCLLTDPTLIHNLAASDQRLIAPEQAPTPASRIIAQVIVRRATLDNPGALGVALDTIDDPAIRSLAIRAAAAAELETEHDRDRLREHLLDCLLQWRRREIRSRTRSTSTATGPSMPDMPGPSQSTEPGLSTEQAAATATDDNTDFAALIEARRQLHQSTGGDPLALPRPITP